MIKKRLIKNKCLYKLFLFMKGNPTLFKLKSFYKNNRNLLVNENTNLCISGYPRCGNTFTTVLISELTNNEVEIAHHTHSIANLKLSLKYNIPTLVLIRDPIDSITSFAIRTNEITIQNMLQEYIFYYNYVRKHSKYFSILPFDTLTSDLSKTLQMINDELDINIRHENYESINELQDHIFNIIESNSTKWNKNKEKYKSIAIPNQKRNANKDKKIKIKSLPEYSEAKKLYENIKNVI